MYKHAALGGTFDHFHAGHKRILDFAFHHAENVTIGITSAPLSAKSFPQTVEPYPVRKQYLQSYLVENGLEKRAHISPINDIYGPAIFVRQFDLIVVTQETKPNAIEINKKRKSAGLPPLKIMTVPFLKGKDRQIISSTRIRKGLIDRTGEAYLQYFTRSKQLYLPRKLRMFLRKPLGKIIQGDINSLAKASQKAVSWIKSKDPVLTMAVGDIISQTLLSAQFRPDISIIDFRSRRQNLFPEKLKSKAQTANPAGTISKESVIKLMEAIKMQSKPNNNHTKTIIVNGEEDLLALPAIMLAPLGSVVTYGQFDLGIVLVYVTEEIKDKVRGIIKQFE